ncbi:hypothetical protein ATO3_03655 [Marinibacterium profundimaris]|uniref:Lipid/polyisoprenoid-binding YceI-like domain-containing protein n=2 Tax=Marinibacterium profundimaris TaxID=1679460 RepID=A0A225NT01_9RHOB|nr:hypothetical protein ATO3_03655 [Marinibacterium profundimaris]
MPRLLLALLATAGAATAQEAPQIERSFPAQSFTLDPAHASVIFSVNHIGFSNYTAGFDDISAILVLDPDAPETSLLEVTIDIASLDLPHPPEGFREMLLSPDWLDAAANPRMTYISDTITLTGEDTATITGDLTLRGITAPVTLAATYNGGWGKQPFEPHARVGFSASGTLNRSDFGLTTGLPPAGSDFGVGDTVTLTIETEWIGEPFE